MKLPSYLLILAVGTLLPVIILAVIGALWFVSRERETFQRGAMKRTRALVTAVDTELNRSITTLNALAASRHLDTDNLRAFHDEAIRVLKTQPDWLTISLAHRRRSMSSTLYAHLTPSFGGHLGDFARLQ
jgi:hypothetical protein